MAAKPAAEDLRDPYEVLGVPRDATAEAIRAAYRKLALKYHPDKSHASEDQEQAAERFKEISTAHGILSDPEKRRKYDVGGFAAMEPSDLDMEIDISQLGVAGTAFAAMFSRLGVPIKTAVAPQVLEMAYEGKFECEELQFGQRVSDKVEKQCAKFFTMHVDQDTIDQGFVIAAHSPALSKFKLLLFEQAPDGHQWELVRQEDSSRMRKVTAAALFFLQLPTVTIGSAPSPLETGGDLEQVLFKRLQGVRPRETVPLKPGAMLFAVYCDNWFKRATFTLEALSPAQLTANACSRVQQVDQQLLERKREVSTFEADFRKAQQEYQKACEKFGEHRKATEEVLAQREDCYAALLHLDQAAQQQLSTAQAATAGVSQAASKVFSGLPGLWGGGGGSKASKPAAVS